MIPPYALAVVKEEEKKLNRPIPRNLAWRGPNPKDSIY
jgi:hypothetical protein